MVVSRLAHWSFLLSPFFSILASQVLNQTRCPLTDSDVSIGQLSTLGRGDVLSGLGQLQVSPDLVTRSARDAQIRCEMSVRLLPETFPDMGWHLSRCFAQLVPQFAVLMKRGPIEDCSNCIGSINRLLKNLQFFQ